MPYRLMTDGQGAEITTRAMVAADADFTQLITVTTAGTPVQGPAKTNPGGWVVQANPGNTNQVYVMYHGQTAAAKGYPLKPGDTIVLSAESLASFDFDADTNGAKAHAIKI